MKSREKKPLNRESILTITDFFDSLSALPGIPAGRLLGHTVLFLIQCGDVHRLADGDAAIFYVVHQLGKLGQ